MSEAATPSIDAFDPQAAGMADTGRPRWSQVWHIPVLLVGVGLFVVGVYLALPQHAPTDVPGALDTVATLLRANNLDEAETRLDAIGQEAGLATPDDLGRYWQYKGDLAYMKLHALPGKDQAPEQLRVAHEHIVQLYSQAEQHPRPLEASSLRRYADTLVALNRQDQAIALLDRLHEAPAERRYTIVRDLIEHHLAQDRVDPASMDRLIDRFRRELARETDADQRRAQSIWLAETRARLRLDADDPGGAIDILSPRIVQLIAESGSGGLGPLHLLLAQSFEELGDYEEALRQYDQAASLLEATDARQADVLIGRGRIALAQGRQLAEPLAYFTTVVDRYPAASAWTEALVHKSDIEARQGSFAEAARGFRDAVQRLLTTTPRPHDLIARLDQIITDHSADAIARGDHELALRLLTQVRPLHEPDLPAELLLRLAQVHEAVGEKRLEVASGSEGRLPPPPDTRRVLNQEAAYHFEQAGDFFLRHAAAVTLHDDAHGDSLWSAAEAYDRAERWPEAISTYTKFVDSRQADARHLEARHRLGLAYLAQDQPDAALGLFKELEEQHPKARWTYESLVPMAKAYARTDQPAAARRTLSAVVDDHPSIRPDSAIYRDALVELGKLHYRLGAEDPAQYVSAIRRFDEAVKRFARTDRGPELRYLLADAYRQSVGELDRRLAEPHAQRQRLELQRERSRRLEEAQKLFNQVVTELDAKAADARTPLEALYLKNAYFYQADAAYDRGRYEASIALYDQAARRWEQDPASLVALVQIVNAYCELGRYDRARAANEKALWQLERMPEDAFNDPRLPMTRRHWQEWLRWTSELTAQAAKPPAPGAPRG